MVTSCPLRVTLLSQQALFDDHRYFTMTAAHGEPLPSFCTINCRKTSYTLFYGRNTPPPESARDSRRRPKPGDVYIDDAQNTVYIRGINAWSQWKGYCTVQPATTAVHPLNEQLHFGPNAPGDRFVWLDKKALQIYYAKLAEQQLVRRGDLYTAPTALARLRLIGPKYWKRLLESYERPDLFSVRSFFHFLEATR